MADDPRPTCPACLTVGARRFAHFQDGDFFGCRSCELLFSPDLRPLRRDGLRRSAVVSALQPLRERNFARILDHLAARAGRGARLLEVGSSTGVFLALAASRGFEVSGIEPDPYFVELSADRYPALAPRVTTGYFPAQCPAGRFDVICFNDVFEHIPDAPSILAGARDLLTERGSISLSIPASEGFFFRLATLAHRVGYEYPLVRMLQLDYPFPHLYYFGRRSMDALAQRLGLQVDHVAALEVLTADSIAARFAMDDYGGGVRTLQIGLAQGAFAVQQALPRALAKPDLLHFVLTRRG